MAYPILTDIFHAQWIFNDASGLPEDQYVNNWYFRNDAPIGIPSPGAYETVTDAIEAVLTAFYTGTFGAEQGPLIATLSPNVTSATLKVYDLGFAPPRYPVVEPRAITVAGSGDPMPNEVACCLSFKGGNGPSKRGRIYYGPLNQAAIETTGRPDDVMRGRLAAAAENVLNTTENVTWVVASPTTSSTTVVTEGWVDNAFDTQRSRGRAPTDRLVWPTT